MKNLTYIAIIGFIFSLVSFAQQGPGPFRKGAVKKIRELEKVKLLEALDLNEETNIKFFSRRNQHQNEIRVLEDRLDNILDDMENEIQKGGDASEPKIKKLTDDFYATTSDIHKAKTDFLISLKDILTPEQIAKLIVFERNFREEMRDILMKERFRRRGNQ